jgi:exopolysaccharide production protein ExoQ
MISLFATVVVGIAIVTLFRLDRGDGSVSHAIWVPFAWLLIESSRPIGSWITLSAPGNGGGSEYIDGSPLDRSILTFLLILGVFVLSRRFRQVRDIVKANPALIVYFVFCLISLLWADYPFVVLKRWIRSVGDVAMVLIVITERNPLEAFRRLFARVGFLVVPLSILFIRFYPVLGRSYSRGGAPEWTGVGTDKNALGMICMIYGVVFLWRWIITLSKPKSKQRTRSLITISSMLVMILYLLLVVNSQTALSCFLMGATLVAVTLRSRACRRPALLTVIVTGMIGLCYGVLILGIGSSLLTLLGRNATLTGRTEVWSTLLAHATNPWIGAGYENFWIGERYELFVRLLGGLNQAHNGYIEIYLNIGFVGLALLGGIIITGYKSILNGFRSDREAASLKIAFFVMCLIYNFTEASFKMMCPVWFTFLWAVIAVPTYQLKVRRSVTAWQKNELWASQSRWRDIPDNVVQ